MSELRTRMIRDMALRGLSPRTHEAYIAAVVRLAKYYKRAPDQLTNDEVQGYLAHLIQVRKLSWSLRRSREVDRPRSAGVTRGGTVSGGWIRNGIGNLTRRAEPQATCGASRSRRPAGRCVKILATTLLTFTESRPRTRHTSRSPARRTAVGRAPRRAIPGLGEEIAPQRALALTYWGLPW